MERTLKRELRLDAKEVAEAVKYWLVEKHDVQIGDDPLVEFAPEGIICQITSTDEVNTDLFATLSPRPPRGA